MASRVLIMFICLSLLLPVMSSEGKSRLHPEKYYQNQWCKGRVEVVLPDKTRCDCVTDTHAIEVDFGSKWAEAIGQSLYYSLQTGKRAGVLLILEDQKDYKYWLRLNSTIQHFKLPIDTWKVGE